MFAKLLSSSLHTCRVPEEWSTRKGHARTLTLHHCEHQKNGRAVFISRPDFIPSRWSRLWGWEGSEGNQHFNRKILCQYIPHFIKYFIYKFSHSWVCIASTLGEYCKKNEYHIFLLTNLCLMPCSSWGHPIGKVGDGQLGSYIRQPRWGGGGVGVGGNGVWLTDTYTGQHHWSIQRKWLVEIVVHSRSVIRPSSVESHSSWEPNDQYLITTGP